RAENLTQRLQVTPGVAAAPAPAEPAIWATPPEAAPPARLPAAPVATNGDGPSAAPAPPPPAPALPPPPNVGNGPRPELPPPGSFKAIQLYDCYLVLETPEGMLVIDQHALHERILFEQLKRRLRAGPLETQRLLIPEPVELTAEQAARALDQRAALAELGLGVEDFGGGTVLLTSYPAILNRRPPREVLKAGVGHLLAKEPPATRGGVRQGLLSLMACHSAVRAGDRLSAEEIAALLEQRQLADDTHHCPHGRPTALLFSRHDLERQFRRV